MTAKLSLFWSLPLVSLIYLKRGHISLKRGHIYLKRGHISLKRGNMSLKRGSWLLIFIGDTYAALDKTATAVVLYIGRYFIPK